MKTIETIAYIIQLITLLTSSGFVIYGAVLQLKEQSRRKNDKAHKPSAKGYVYMLCALIIAIGGSYAGNGLLGVAKSRQAETQSVSEADTLDIYKENDN